MNLTIQERLKDLRVAQGITLEQFAAAHIADHGYCHYTVQQDMDRIKNKKRQKLESM